MKAFIMLLLLATASAQEVQWSTKVGDVIVTQYDDGSMVAMSVVDPGEIVTSYADATTKQSPIQEQGPQAPTPTLTTSWTDKSGVVHTVSTPIPSTTPSGLQKASALHNTLVDIMQGAHPPRPPVEPS